MVVDTSVALSWILPGEDTEKALALRNQAADKSQPLLMVPPTFWYEVTNVLWVAKRRKRLSRKNAIEALALLIDFEFTVWIADPDNCLKLSFAHDLAVYDSVYLDIALDQKAMLWTMDQSLKKIAAGLGIAVQP